VAPELNADSAYGFVARQCSFGPRVPGSEAHRKCGDWLVATFRRFGARVVENTGTIKNHVGTLQPVRNIIASYNPEAPQRVLLSAHWDSRPQADADSVNKSNPVMGANDAASGVAVLLEIARVLHQNPGLATLGIDLILWDAEDGGVNGQDDSWCLGSQFWAANRHVPGYQALWGINLDMVGARGATFPQEQNSVTFAPELVNRVWKTAHQLGYGNYFIFTTRGPILDDHVYVTRNAGIPCIDIIHLNVDERAGHSFFPHWHTNHDVLDHIDGQVLKAVGQTVLQVVVSGPQ
jgi:Zn-dependent M28 family amino/carboxypeptidase